MTIDVGGVSGDALLEYARIPIAFEVRSVFRVDTDLTAAAGLESTWNVENC
jgi:hypothetical protein